MNQGSFSSYIDTHLAQECILEDHSSHCIAVAPLFLYGWPNVYGSVSEPSVVLFCLSLHQYTILSSADNATLISSFQLDILFLFIALLHLLQPPLQCRQEMVKTLLNFREKAFQCFTIMCEVCSSVFKMSLTWWRKSFLITNSLRDFNHEQVLKF